MNKKYLSIFLGAVLIMSVTLCASPLIFASQKAENNGENEIVPYIIHSDSYLFKLASDVRHEFPGKFTADLTPRQVFLFKTLGVELEKVQIYHILVPPDKCGDGTCQGFESPETCPDDCSSDGGGDEEGDDGESPVERSCYPDDQTPWGIGKAYNDDTITITNGGTGVNVTVLDTGVNKEHLDLKNRVKQCVDFSTGPPIKVRIKEGSCEDTIGHGTHVAGTILADGGADGLGIYGIAPEANLLAYKVCGDSGCYTDDIAAAIDYAGSHGANIVSMSFGGNSQSSLIKEAIDRNSQILFVAAAGNDGPEDGSIDYPGAYVEVIAAGAINSSENVPDWSSRGINDGDSLIEEKEIEFGMPGVNVESTFKDGCYTSYSGTSMATPHVSGMAAKLWKGTASDTRNYLQSIARDIYLDGDDTATGLGLLELEL